MGGRNHQPTSRKITGVSAWLSKQVGAGYILVLMANNHLEDAIMLGMNKLHVEDLVPDLAGTASEHIQKTIIALKQSCEVLDRIQTGFSRLLDVAQTEGYTGNPLGFKLDKLALATKFEGILVQPSINTKVWKELEHHIVSDNILKTLEWEASEFDKLSQPRGCSNNCVSLI